MINTTWKSKLRALAGSTLLGISLLVMASQANAETSAAPGASIAPSVPQAAEGATIQLAQWGPPPPRGWEYPPRYHGRRYYEPHYVPPSRYRRSNSHVQWCLNRYRSYNPRTDQYLGYDGRYHYCRSPYR